jgi:hypothetical protein
MTSNVVRGDLRDRFPARSATGPSRDKITIAELPIRLIAAMSRDPLSRVIRMAQRPRVDARALRRLPFMDRPALESFDLPSRCRRTGCARTGNAPRWEQRPSVSHEKEPFWED